MQHSAIPTETHGGPRREDRMAHKNHYIIHSLCDNRILIHRLFRIILFTRADLMNVYFPCLTVIRHSFCLCSMFIHEQTIHSIANDVLPCDNFIDFHSLIPKSHCSLSGSNCSLRFFRLLWTRIFFSNFHFNRFGDNSEKSRHSNF